MLSVAAARALPGSRSPRAKIVIEEQSKNSSLFPWVSVYIYHGKFITSTFININVTGSTQK